MLDLVTPQEDVEQVIRELTSTCIDCRLGLLHPRNKGFLYRGNPMAKIALVGEAPGSKETETGVPFVGPAGQLLEKMLRAIDIDSKHDVLITNVVQCQPGIVDKSQVAPDKDEIAACFPSRALRVLRAMPHLECVMTLGWVAAKAILGGDPKSKTHEGKWAETSLLPGIPIFCLIHPSYLLRDPSPEKSGRAEECLKLFRREYLQKAKDMGGLAQANKAAREQRAGGTLW